MHGLFATKCSALLPIFYVSFLFLTYMSITGKLHMLSYVLECGKFKFVVRIENFFQVHNLNQFLIFQVISEAMKLEYKKYFSKNSAEIFTTKIFLCSAYAELHNNGRLPIFLSCTLIFETFEIG